jgi:hypothetical protein
MDGEGNKILACRVVLGQHGSKKAEAEEKKIETTKCELIHGSVVCYSSLYNFYETMDVRSQKHRYMYRKNFACATDRSSISVIYPTEVYLL